MDPGRRRRGSRRPSPELLARVDAKAVADRSGAGVKAHGGGSGIATTRSGALAAGSGRGGVGTASARRGRWRPRQAVAGATAASGATVEQARAAAAGSEARLLWPAARCLAATAAVPPDPRLSAGSGGWEQSATAAVAVGDGGLGRIWTPAAVGDDGDGVVTAVAAALGQRQLATAVAAVVAAVSSGNGGGRHGVGLLAVRWWRATAQQRFAEAVVGVGGSGDGGCDSGGGGDVGGGEGVGGEVAGCSGAKAVVVVTVFAVIGGMAALVD
uniref:Uncharacterized protein n=1 Tax=Oryza sativa subsp. japonica TaxID=39947 RepID=Q8H578_ORYSJ|nr:hypothetical protein [Oryza sativa Japonica Group]BAD30799.1 hypothetical protein [Oryza sativa Japonica Group]